MGGFPEAVMQQVFLESAAGGPGTQATRVDVSPRVSAQHPAMVTPSSFNLHVVYGSGKHQLKVFCVDVAWKKGKIGD